MDWMGISAGGALSCNCGRFIEVPGANGHMQLFGIVSEDEEVTGSVGIELDVITGLTVCPSCWPDRKELSETWALDRSCDGYEGVTRGCDWKGNGAA